MSTFYLKGLEEFCNGNIDFANDTIKLDYMATSYTPDITTENFYSDVSASVASGASTETLANALVRIDTTNSRVELDADDVSQGPVTVTTNKYIIWKDTGVASTSPLIAAIDLTEGTVTVVSGTLGVTLSGEGIAALNAT